MTQCSDSALFVFSIQAGTKERLHPTVLESVFWNHGRCWSGKWKWQRHIFYFFCVPAKMSENDDCDDPSKYYTLTRPHFSLHHWTFQFNQHEADYFVACCNCIEPFGLRVSLTTWNIFRVYCSGAHGPVLLLLHGGGHSALSWAVFTVSVITFTTVVPLHSAWLLTVLSVLKTIRSCFTGCHLQQD